MRLTGSLRAIIRSPEKAKEDMNVCRAIIKRYAMAQLNYHPPNAMPFCISLFPSTQSEPHPSDIIWFKSGYPRIVAPQQPPFLSRIIPGMVCSKWLNPKWLMHRYRYRKQAEAVANRDMIVNISRNTLKMILDAMKKKNLSPLRSLLMDDGILRGVETRSGLSSLTNRQLSTLNVTDDDFIGIDGIVDTWIKLKLDKEDPSGLLKSIKFGKSEKHNKPIMIYSVDLAAILRKRILIPKNSCLPPPKEHLYQRPPKAYGFPSVRMLYATLEFAHLGIDNLSNEPFLFSNILQRKFSNEPFLHNFHVYSF